MLTSNAGLHNRTVRHLDVSRNDIGGYRKSCDAMSALGAVLTASSLTQLNISGNGLNAKDIQGFAEQLADGTTLTCLNVASNKLTQGCWNRGNVASDAGVLEFDITGIIALSTALQQHG